MSLDTPPEFRPPRTAAEFALKIKNILQDALDTPASTIVDTPRSFIMAVEGRNVFKVTVDHLRGPSDTITTTAAMHDGE